MSSAFRKNPLALAMGAAFAVAGFAAEASVFQAIDLAGGYQLAAAGDKAGEHKCGADKKEAEGKCGGDKHAEGKCGGDKKAEGKCGADKKKAEGKCGEGKCGGKK